MAYFQVLKKSQNQWTRDQCSILSRDLSVGGFIILDNLSAPCACDLHSTVKRLRLCMKHGFFASWNVLSLTTTCIEVEDFHGNYIKKTLSFCLRYSFQDTCTLVICASFTCLYCFDVIKSFNPVLESRLKSVYFIDIIIEL